MNSNTRDSYLETEILTATPQRLRKMLLDGAVRFSSSARDAFQKGDDELGEQLLDRCTDILGELFASIKTDDELAKQVAALYAFLIQEIIKVRKNRELNALEDVIEILEIERETWRQVCVALPNKPQAIKDTVAEIGAGQAQQILANSDANAASSILETNSGGFELEA